MAVTHDVNVAEILDDAERQLVERARHGDSRALGLLYQRHVDRVYSYILFRVRDEALAEDLTQDVFLQALRGLESFDWRGAVAPWLLRIARNAIIDHWRRRARRPERALSMMEDDDEDGNGDRLDRLAADTDEGMLGDVERAVDRERIAQAADLLTELQRQVVALRFAAGLSIRETAEVMERSEGAIKNLQHHALRALKRHLANYEVMT
jgi:RNA polymerase sigma-70 factor, ECF subfamily